MSARTTWPHPRPAGDDSTEEGPLLVPPPRCENASVPASSNGDDHCWSGSGSLRAFRKPGRALRSLDDGSSSSSAHRAPAQPPGGAIGSLPASWTSARSPVKAAVPRAALLRPKRCSAAGSVLSAVWGWWLPCAPSTDAGARASRPAIPRLPVASIVHIIRDGRASSARCREPWLQRSIRAPTRRLPYGSPRGLVEPDAPVPSSRRERRERAAWVWRIYVTAARSRSERDRDPIRGSGHRPLLGCRGAGAGSRRTGRSARGGAQASSRELGRPVSHRPEPGSAGRRRGGGG